MNDIGRFEKEDVVKRLLRQVILWSVDLGIQRLFATVLVHYDVSECDRIELPTTN